MNKPTDFQLCMQCQTHLTRLSVTFHLDNAEITEPKYKRLSVLTHNDGHLDADFEAKGCAGIRETVCHILQLFIGMGEECSVICKKGPAHMYRGCYSITIAEYAARCRICSAMQNLIRWSQT